MRANKLTPIILATLLPITAIASPTPYLQADAGVAIANWEEHWLGDYDSDGNFIGHVAGGLLWGQERFHYGMELGYAGYSNLKNTSDEFPIFLFPIPGTFIHQVSGYNVSLLGVLKYVFDSNVTTFLKLGAVYANQNIKTQYNFFDYPSDPVREKEHAFAPELAIGIGYKMSPQVEIQLTADEAFLSSSLSSNPDAASIGSLMLGLTYSFS